jgi:hypothetical protein
VRCTGWWGKEVIVVGQDRGGKTCIRNYLRYVILEDERDTPKTHDPARMGSFEVGLGSLKIVTQRRLGVAVASAQGADDTQGVVGQDGQSRLGACAWPAEAAERAHAAMPLQLGETEVSKTPPRPPSAIPDIISETDHEASSSARGSSGRGGLPMGKQPIFRGDGRAALLRNAPARNGQGSSGIFSRRSPLP